MTLRKNMETFSNRKLHTSNSETESIIIHINFNIRIENKWTIKYETFIVYTTHSLPYEISCFLIHENSFRRRLKNLKLNEFTFWLSVFLTFYSCYYLYYMILSFIEREQRANNWARKIEGGWTKKYTQTRAQSNT